MTGQEMKCTAKYRPVNSITESTAINVYRRARSRLEISLRSSAFI